MHFYMGGKESAENTIIEIDTINEQSNPIKRKIREITKNFPFWPMQIVYPKVKGDNISGRFNLYCGLIFENNTSYTKKLLFVDITIRQTGIYESDCLFLFNTIGEYCLAKKTEKVLGNNRDKWKELIDKTEWTK